MKTNKAVTLVELMCALGLAGSVASVVIYKLQSIEIIETTKAVVNKANAAQLNTAYQQGVIMGRYTPTSTAADTLTAQMFELGMVSEFDYKGGFVFKQGFFYAVPGFSPKIADLPSLTLPSDAQLPAATL